MSKLLIQVQMVRTRLYRVVLFTGSAAAVVLLFAQRYGPGIGLTPWDLALIGAVGTFLVGLARQIGDPATSTATPLSNISIAPAPAVPTEGTITAAPPTIGPKP